jgi:hypothetical protein
MRAPRKIDVAAQAGAARFHPPIVRSPATRIRALVLASTVSVFGSAASAQIGPPGGIVPYTVPPDAATAGMAAGAANGANQNPTCYWQRGGRNPPQDHCDDQPPPPAKNKPNSR